MPIRFLPGITAGLLVGVILGDALIAGYQFLTPELDIKTSIAMGRGLAPGPTTFLLLSWLLAATVSATMATLVAQARLAGWLTGSLWLFPTSLIAGLGNFSDTVLALAAVSSLTGALIGTRLAWLSLREN